MGDDPHDLQGTPLLLECERTRFEACSSNELLVGGGGCQS